MAKGSDNPFPSVLVVETAAASISSPSAGRQRVFIDTDNKLKRKNSGGAVTDLEAAGTPSAAEKVLAFTSFR